MNINKYSPSSHTSLSGEESFELDAGDGIKIEKILGTGPETILDTVVPTGKKWILRIDLVGDEVSV